ncbi:MAG TPA: CsbD family protein [Candidatus Acidoferrales bacterium]|nr:CsbD family protein [Candidatus Acidoferrales bacterium]
MPKESTKDEVKGKTREIKGKIKEKAGRALHRPILVEEGRGDVIAGKIQKKIGQVKKAFGH